MFDTYHGVDVRTKNEPVRHLWDAADKFTEYFEQHRLYFTKDVCSNIDGLNNKLHALAWSSSSKRLPINKGINDMTGNLDDAPSHV